MGYRGAKVDASYERAMFVPQRNPHISYLKYLSFKPRPSGPIPDIAAGLIPDGVHFRQSNASPLEKEAVKLRSIDEKPPYIGQLISSASRG